MFYATNAYFKVTFMLKILNKALHRKAHIAIGSLN